MFYCPLQHIHEIFYVEKHFDFAVATFFFKGDQSDGRHFFRCILDQVTVSSHLTQNFNTYNDIKSHKQNLGPSTRANFELSGNNASKVLGSFFEFREISDFWTSYDNSSVFNWNSEHKIPQVNHQIINTLILRFPLKDLVIALFNQVILELLTWRKFGENNHQENATKKIIGNIGQLILQWTWFIHSSDKKIFQSFTKSVLSCSTGHSFFCAFMTILSSGDKSSIQSTYSIRFLNCPYTLFYIRIPFIKN